jgi:hypothetical protein
MRVLRALQAAGIVLFGAICTDRVLANPPLPSKECSPLVENREACTSTVTTFAGASGSSTTPSATRVSAQASNSPPPVRVAPKVAVTVVIHKRPLESVQSQLTCNQPPKPDFIPTILGKGSTPLGVVTIAAHTRVGVGEKDGRQRSIPGNAPAIVAYRGRDLSPIVRERFALPLHLPVTKRLDPRRSPTPEAPEAQRAETT